MTKSLHHEERGTPVVSPYSDRRRSGRRSLLRGVSAGVGGILFAPFLRQLEAHDEPQKHPLRVVCFLQGNGIFPDRIQPEGLPRSTQSTGLMETPLAGFRLPPSIRPLQPFTDRMSIIQGLSGRVALGNHGMGMGALGCFPSQKNVFAETIDSVISKLLPGHFSHVGLGIASSPDTSVIYNVSAAGKNKPLPTQCDPLRAHQTLFAFAMGDQPKSEYESNTQLLDFLVDDVKRMQKRLNGVDREKLDRYMNAFESMARRRSALAAIADRIRVSAPELHERFGGESFAFQRLEAQFDIAAGAFAAGLTSVITISSGCGRDQTGVNFDGTELGISPGTVSAHEIGHGQTVNGMAPDELHIRTQAKHCEKLAAFLDRLISIPEGDGSMLDNTLIVYMSDAAEAHHPQAREWPLIVIGDLGGRLHTHNRVLQFPNYGKPGHRTVSSFFVTMLHALGDRRNTFGVADVHLADLDDSGPVSELLV